MDIFSVSGKMVAARQVRSTVRPDGKVQEPSIQCQLCQQDNTSAHGLSHFNVRMETDSCLLSESSRTDKTDKLSSKVAFYRGNQPRSERGLISFDDIKDSNLLKYTEEKSGKRETCLTQYLASHQSPGLPLCDNLWLP